MAKYKVSISEVTEYDETFEQWRNTITNEIGGSKYSFNDNERDSLVKETKATGLKKEDVNQVYTQSVDSENPTFIPQLVKFINEL